MIKIREWNFVRKFRWNLRKNWKQYIVKTLSYVMVAVVAVAAVLALVGFRNSRAVNLAQIEEATAKLDAANLESQELLNQVETVKRDAQTMLDQVAKKEEEVSQKIEELEIAIDEAKDKETINWILPMRYTNVSSYYGNRTHPISGEQNFHTGVDLAGPQGTPIVASRSGTVVKAEYQDAAGYFVTIDHQDGYDSSYLHMQKYIVEVGQVVIAGQVIGYCGQSGSATGPHLHFEVYHDGRMMNPAKLIKLY